MHLPDQGVSDLPLMASPIEGVIILRDLTALAGWAHRLRWRPFLKGVEIHPLYARESGTRAALLRFQPGGRVPLHEHQGYEHIFILSGAQVDENSRAEAGTLVINPPGSVHSVLSETGCLVLAIYEKPVRFLEPDEHIAPRYQATTFHGEVPPVLLAVNGTLMRGLELNKNLLAVGARFVRETSTAPAYRLWSIGDRHPAMVRVSDGGVPIAVEVWALPPAGLAQILQQEPPGLSIGKVRLADGSEVLGVLGEPILCDGQKEITAHRGWRAYKATTG